jgi:hypothetical protein
MFASKEDILGAQDLRYESVPVPEWGEKPTRIRSLTAEERDEFELFMSKVAAGLEQGNIRAHLAALTIVDGEGKRMFSVQEAVALGQKNALALNRVWLASIKLSGIARSSVKEAIEDFPEGPSGDSSTDSASS